MKEHEVTHFVQMLQSNLSSELIAIRYLREEVSYDKNMVKSTVVHDKEYMMADAIRVHAERMMELSVKVGSMSNPYCTKHLTLNPHKD